MEQQATIDIFFTLEEYDVLLMALDVATWSDAKDAAAVERLRDRLQDARDQLAKEAI